jgi:hypothetical protein
MTTPQPKMPGFTVVGPHTHSLATQPTHRTLHSVHGVSHHTDPYGKAQNEPGAKVDAGKVRMHLITGGMARAITEVAKIATFGAAKYTDGGWVTVPDGFRRYEDAQQRHAAIRHMGETVDPESGLLHLAHEAWNALAKLDLYLREQEKKQDLF